MEGLISRASLMEVVYSRPISSFMEKKAKLACHKQANIHRSCFQRLDRPQGNTHYPIFLLFHIEDNVHFKFGGRKFKNSTFFQKSNCSISLPILVIYF